MLTKPKYGWTDLQIGNLTQRASYLTDVPNDCLDAFNYALQSGSPAVVFFDAEGWDFHLIASYYCSYVIVDKDKSKLYVFDKTINDLAKELYDDINNNFDDWSDWEMYDTVEEREENERRLKEKLAQLFLMI